MEPRCRDSCDFASNSLCQEHFRPESSGDSSSYSASTYLSTATLASAFLNKSISALETPESAYDLTSLSIISADRRYLTGRASLTPHC
jgi:hypothetical protein